MRMRKKKNLDARWAQVSDLLADSASCRGRWKESFAPEARRLVVELGCGKGTFITTWAQKAPDTLFVGWERVPEALLMSMEKAKRQKLPNLRFVCGDVEQIGDTYAPGEIDRLHINFCDPWTATKKAKRRLTHRRFLEQYHAILAPEGELHFKTDNENLYLFTLEELQTQGFALVETSTDWHSEPHYPGDDVETEYEARFVSQGLPIFRIVAKK